MEPPNKTQQTWWSAPRRGGAVAERVSALCSFLLKEQRDRRRANVLHMRIVATDDLTGRGHETSAMTRAKAAYMGVGERSRYFLCAGLVNTASSVITAGKPTLQYLTQAGDWDLQRKARLRTLALSGQMRNLMMESLGPRIFKDAAVCDVGGVYGYVHPDTGKVALERVLPNELLVDHNESVNAEPRNLYWVRPVNRERLKELYPERAKELDACMTVGIEDRDAFLLSRQSATETILVYNAWHLGTSKKPGRFVMCAGKTVLVDEEYKHQEFPIVVYRYDDSIVGWYGQSLVARTKDAQRRINLLLRKVERSQDLNSKCITVVPKGSGLSREQINNLPGTVLEVEDARPELLTWNGTPPDLRTEIPAIREETLANEGLSEQQVQGERMPGVNSGVGLRAADDIQARRHVDPQRRWERFHVEVARLIARCNDDATELDKDYTVTAQVKRGRRDYIHTIKWADVQVDESDARIQVFPTSGLSTTPKGRRDDVMGLLQAGLIDQQSALELLDLPDLDTETRDRLAEVDYSRWLVERVMDDEDYYVDPIIGVEGLKLCLGTAHKAYVQCVYSEAPETVLDRLRTFLEELQSEITRLEQPVAQPPAEANGAPAAAPQQMPSDQPPGASQLGSMPTMGSA